MNIPDEGISSSSSPLPRPSPPMSTFHKTEVGARMDDDDDGNDDDDYDDHVGLVGPVGQYFK